MVKRVGSRNFAHTSIQWCRNAAAEELAIFSSAARQRLAKGWTRHQKCRAFESRGKQTQEPKTAQSHKGQIPGRPNTGWAKRTVSVFVCQPATFTGFAFGSRAPSKGQGMRVAAALNRKRVSPSSPSSFSHAEREQSEPTRSHGCLTDGQNEGNAAALPAQSVCQLHFCLFLAPSNPMSQKPSSLPWVDACVDRILLRRQ